MATFRSCDGTERAYRVVGSRRAPAPPRWAARAAHPSACPADRASALTGYYTDGAFDPPAIRAALGRLDAPVLVYAGGADFGPTPDQAAEATRLFPSGQLIVQPGGGHYPWLDDPSFFADSTEKFLQ